MNKFINRITRRDAIVGLASTAAAAALPGLSAASTVEKLPDQRGYWLSFSYVTKRPEVTNAQLIDRYENEHAVEGARGFEKDFLRYSRNYVARVIGEAPGFDCLGEFMPPPDFPKNLACGAKIDPNWSRVISGQVTEYVLHGSTWSYEPGPTAKRAFLINAPAQSEERLRADAMKLARQLSPKSRRVTLYMQHQVQDTYACVDAVAPAQAILMVWPKEKETLPDQLKLISSALRVPTVLDFISYSSDVPSRT